MSSVVVWSLVSALAGFLFGFDTVVISGAERTIQDLWGLSPWVHGVAMASALYGTVLGAMFGGWPSDRLGRKPTLVWVGISTVASPLYISEIAPPAARGRLTGLFQLNIVLGILAAFFSNYLLEGVADDWRWMLGAEAFPALAYTLAALAIPESPRWLLLRGGDGDRPLQSALGHQCRALLRAADLRDGGPR